jgi:hypothetical protein
VEVGVGVGGGGGGGGQVRRAARLGGQGGCWRGWGYRPHPILTPTLAPPDGSPPEVERVERGEAVRLSEAARLGDRAEAGICICICACIPSEICISTEPSIQLGGDADLAFWRCSSEVCISASAS